MSARGATWLRAVGPMNEIERRILQGVAEEMHRKVDDCLLERAVLNRRCRQLVGSRERLLVEQFVQALDARLVALCSELGNLFTILGSSFDAFEMELRRIQVLLRLEHGCCEGKTQGPMALGS